MNENYSFEDKMKSLFEEEREHRYEPEQWRRLSRRLKDHDRPPVAWWQRWMPLGFAVLVGLLGWQLWQQQGLQRTVAELSDQLVTMEKEDQSTSTNQSKTVVVYDTIYRQTVIVGQSLSTAIAPSRDNLNTRNWPDLERSTILANPSTPFPALRGIYPPNPSTTFQERAVAGFQYYRTLSAEANGGTEGEAVLTIPYFITDLLELKEINKLGEAPLAFPTLFAPAFAPNPLPGPSLWQRIKPKGYAVSLGGGGFKSLAYGNDDGDPFGSVEIEFLLGKKISLEVGGAFFSRSFRLKPENYEQPTDLPALAPLSPDDKLERITGNLNQLQFPVGFRYYPLQFNQWSFYAAAGIAPTLGLRSTLKYTYEDVDDTYYDLPPERALSTQLKIGAMYGSLGLQRGVGKHWRAGLSFTAQQALGGYDFDYQRPSWGRWRLGVGYGLR